MSIVAPAVQPHEMESHLHSPPESSKESPLLKNDASASDSELSDIEDPEGNAGVIEPESWADDGRVPVFRPTMEQFKSFPRYMQGVNPYGMKSGIVKVIPPPEWKAALPRLDEAIKTIRVKEPIKQDIMGTSGTYRQANILHQRSYNLPQWRNLCEQSEHQPPAKRGERRMNQDKPTVPRNATRKAKAEASTTKSTPATGGKRKPGRSARGKANKDASATPDRLPTPVSPSMKHEDDLESVKAEQDDDEEAPVRGRMGGRQSQAISVSSRRKYNRREATAKVDEIAFKDFKYELCEDFSAERCEELERAYWKTLTYAPPLYGADMPGSLFTDATTTWNLGKLENILDVLGTKIPGVNTAYLYLGMWKATFAWHLEDVDLYSINYLHFGAPKQWYSISQGDARRFEAAMKTIWPTDAKACDQFLRHKTFLISPSHLLQNFNIKVNKIVCHPGEFVITFPYGYHSGYNLGYNCAEAVNFGMESWLEYGRVAKKCDCSQAQDSVWIDVREIERKMRGEETEFEETDDEDEDEEDEDETGCLNISTPPRGNGEIKLQAPMKKRKRPVTEKGQPVALKRVRLRLKAPAREPCILCPNDIPGEPLLTTEDGEKVHRMCALYIPETSIDSGEKEIVRDVKHIAKARMDLKCNYCRSKKGACFQCSQKKCIRAYHATCAAAAGVFVEQGEVPVFGEDGTEYKEQGIEFSCRFHRTKRDKNLQANDLSELGKVRKTGLALNTGDTCQMQYYRADIFAGIVVENCRSEETLLVNILPRGERIEVEYKWLLVPSPSDYKMVKPSANAIPMPKSYKAKESLNTSKRKADDDTPLAGDVFLEGCIWTEFKNDSAPRNPYQVKVDFAKENQIWYYLGKNSTEARAQFTEDPRKMRHNPRGLFLETIPRTTNTIPRQSYAASYPTHISQNAVNTSKGSIRLPPQKQIYRKDNRLFAYKPSIPDNNTVYRVDPQAYLSQQNFLHAATPSVPQPASVKKTPTLAFGTDPRYSTAPPILPGATVDTYARYSGNQKTPPNPAHGLHYQQSKVQLPRLQSSHLNALSSTQLSPQFEQTKPQSVPQQPRVQYEQPKAQPPQQQYRQNLAQQTQYQPQQQPQARLQPPQQPRAVLAPPASYRPAYTPPVSQPPRQNPFQARKPAYRSDPFSKYAYLQREHNRSALDYKTPYRPGGGFMNGYEGNLKRHLEQKMFKNSQGPVSDVVPPAPSHVSDHQRMYSGGQPSPTSYSPSSQPPYDQAAPNPQQSVFQPQQIIKPGSQNGWDKREPTKHSPAVGQEYTNGTYRPGCQEPRPTSSHYSASFPNMTQGPMRYGSPQVQNQYQQPQRTQKYQNQQPSSVAHMSSQKYQRHQRSPVTQQQRYQTHQQSPVLQSSQQVYRSHQNPPVLQAPPQGYDSHQASPPLHSPQYFQPYQNQQQYPPPPRPVVSPAPTRPNTGTTVKVILPPGQAHMQYHQHQIPQQGGYRDPKPVYSHQQHFQKNLPAGPSQAQFQPPPSRPVQTQHYHSAPMYSELYAMAQSQEYTAPYRQQSPRDYPDVPPDSTSLVEKMMADLRKIRSRV